MEGACYLHNYLTQPFSVWLGSWEGACYLHNYLTQPFRVWLGGGEGSCYLHNYLTQPFSIWLGSWEGACYLHDYWTQPFRSVYIRIYSYIYIYMYIHIYIYIEWRGKDAGYEIRGFGKRAQPSQGERRIPTDTQRGRRKVGRHIPTYYHIYILCLTVSDWTDSAVWLVRVSVRQRSHLRLGKALTCSSVSLASRVSASQLGKLLTCSTRKSHHLLRGGRWGWDGVWWGCDNVLLLLAQR